jgi:hypothetical protein
MKCQLGVLLIIFSVNVAQGLVESPDKCIEKKIFPCLIKTQEDHSSVVFADNNLHLGTETLIELRNLEVHILRGNLWFEGEHELAFSTLFTIGRATGNLWIFASTSRTEIKNLDGKAEVSAIGSNILAPIPIGFQNWFAGPQNSKRSNEAPADLAFMAGVLSPLNPINSISGWIKTFRPTEKSMKQFASLWNQKWQGNVALVADAYQQAANRHIASVREENLRAEAAKQRQNRENAQFRAMFRKKNGLDEL